MKAPCSDSFPSLLEIWFWGPTHPTFLYDVTLFTFFLKSSLMEFLRICNYLVLYFWFMGIFGLFVIANKKKYYLKTISICLVMPQKKMSCLDRQP